MKTFTIVIAFVAVCTYSACFANPIIPCGSGWPYGLSGSPLISSWGWNTPLWNNGLLSAAVPEILPAALPVAVPEILPAPDTSYLKPVVVTQSKFTVTPNPILCKKY